MIVMTRSIHAIMHARRLENGKTQCGGVCRVVRPAAGGRMRVYHGLNRPESEEAVRVVLFRAVHRRAAGQGELLERARAPGVRLSGAGGRIPDREAGAKNQRARAQQLRELVRRQGRGHDSRRAARARRGGVQAKQLCAPRGLSVPAGRGGQAGGRLVGNRGQGRDVRRGEDPPAEQQLEPVGPDDAVFRLWPGGARGGGAAPRAGARHDRQRRVRPAE